MPSREVQPRRDREAKGEQEGFPQAGPSDLGLQGETFQIEGRVQSPSGHGDGQPSIMAENSDADGGVGGGSRVRGVCIHTACILGCIAETNAVL